ncbi:MAG: monofunctional biosynthetic peptidoglycan transglycosylase [Cytophagaceae bacterium]
MKIWKVILKHSLLFFFCYTIEVTLVFKWINPPITPLMAIRILEGLTEGKWVGINKDWESLDKISPYVVKQVIAGEDTKFYDHHGFDWNGIRAAYKYNQTTKSKRFRGGSTISQQTAKNIFLWPYRDWLRKGLETYFTVLIEVIWGKDRIMEMYLNCIEFGPGIYGVEAASQHYFHKSAKKLTEDQSARLVSVIPLPLKRNPLKPSLQMKKRMNIVKKAT